LLFVVVVVVVVATVILMKCSSSNRKAIKRYINRSNAHAFPQTRAVLRS